DVREILLEQRLEERQHPIGLPLLVAHEADALAVERGEPGRMGLGDRDGAGWVVELDAHHECLPPGGRGCYSNVASAPAPRHARALVLAHARAYKSQSPRRRGEGLASRSPRPAILREVSLLSARPGHAAGRLDSRRIRPRLVAVDGDSWLFDQTLHQKETHA